jgi:hypothetical protein
LNTCSDNTIQYFSVPETTSAEQLLLETQRKREEEERNKNRFIALNIRRANYNQQHPARPKLKQLNYADHMLRLGGYYKTIYHINPANHRQPVSAEVIPINPKQRQ